MWFASCCLPVALACAIMAVYVSTVFYVDGSSYRLGDEISAVVAFGRSAIEMIVVYEYDDVELANRTTIVSYEQIHYDLCVDTDLRNRNVDSSYCDSILSLKSAGNSYDTCILCAVSFMGTAAVLAQVFALVRCFCRRSSPKAPYFVAGLATVSVICCIVAIYIAWNNIAKDARNVLSQTYAYYYPVAQLDTEWDNGHVGSSLAGVYLSSVIGLISILATLVCKNGGCFGCCRGGGEASHPPHHGGENPPLLQAEAEGQVASTEPYTAYVGEDYSPQV